MSHVRSSFNLGQASSNMFNQYKMWSKPSTIIVGGSFGMADFALPRTGSVRKPSLGRPPSCQNLQRNSSRRVSFPDFTSKEDQISIRSSDDEEESGSKCCHSCCAWTSLAVGCVVFVVLLLAGSFFSYLQSNLPEVQIQRLNISKIGAVSSNKKTLLDADVELKFNATNKNDIVLEYGKLKMDLSLDGIKMGETNIAAFTQKPHNSTMLNIRSKVKKKAVVKDDVKDLKSNYNTSQLVINVVMKGTLGFHVSGRELSGFPLTIKCLQIDQSAIDSGLRPDCSVRILPFRWIWNSERVIRSHNIGPNLNSRQANKLN